MPESPVNHGAAPAQHAARVSESSAASAAPSASAATVEHALCAYAEPYIRGRRGLVVGGSNSGVGERLLALGARSVHLFDPEPGRAALAPAARGLTVAPLDDRALDFREGAFQFVVIFELAAVPSAPVFLSQLRRLIEAGGAVLVRTAAGPGGLEYGELYDRMSLEFPHVKMIGEVGFGGVAYVELGAEAPEVTVDSQLTEPSPPRSFLALASHEPISLDGYAIVQLPGDGQPVTDAERARLEAGLAEVERQRTHVDALLDTLDREGEKGMRLAMELEVAQKALHDAQAYAAANIAEAMQAGQEASVALQSRLAADLEGQLRAAQSDFASRIEEAEAQLLVQDAQIVRLSKDLIDAKSRLEQPRSTPRVEDSQVKAVEARLSAAAERLAAAEARVSELARQLGAARADAERQTVQLVEATAARALAEEAATRAIAGLRKLEQALAESEKRSAGAILLAGAADGRVEELASLASELQASAVAANERATAADRRLAELMTEVARADEVEGRMQRALAEVTSRAAAAESRAAEAESRAAVAESRTAGSEGRVAGSEGRVAEAERRVAEAQRRAAGLEGRAAEAEGRAAEAEGRAARLEELVREVEGRIMELVLAEQRLAELGPELEQVASEHAREISTLEAQLLERARMLKAQDVELARRARMIEDLLSSLEEVHVGLPPAAVAPRVERPVHDDARVAELRTRLDELAAECARREGELEARAWRIQELELERSLPPSVPAISPTMPDDAALRADNERLESELFTLRQAFVQEHEARLIDDGEPLTRLRAELAEKVARIEELEQRLARVNG